jgi:hypothetical protein
MIKPPLTDMSPWVPGYWITQSGYALSKRDLLDSRHAQDLPTDNTAPMYRAAKYTHVIIDRIMAK